MKNYYFPLSRRIDLKSGYVLYELIFGSDYKYFILPDKTEFNYKEEVCDSIGLLHLQLDSPSDLFNNQISLLAASIISNNEIVLL